MTPEEAIKTIQVAIAEVEWEYPLDYSVAFETAIEALEKQIPKCERKRYIYTIPDIPPSLNKYAGRENVWAYRADKKQWQALCAAYCRPKPSEPIKKCVVRITYFFRTMQRHDPDNYSGKFILDGLREAGIIEDDSFKNVELHLCGSYDKENPRTEIMIMEE